MIYIFIFILTLFDAAISVWGVTTNRMEEGNPLLVDFMNNNALLTGIAVIIIVGLLLLFISKYRFKWMKYAIMSILCVKIFVMYLHTIWM